MGCTQGPSQLDALVLSLAALLLWEIALGLTSPLAQHHAQPPALPPHVRLWLMFVGGWGRLQKASSLP